jgi:hypothetical protein
MQLLTVGFLGRLAWPWLELPETKRKEKKGNINYILFPRPCPSILSTRHIMEHIQPMHTACYQLFLPIFVPRLNEDRIRFGVGFLGLLAQVQPFTYS